MKYIVILALVALTSGCTKSDPTSTAAPKDSVATRFSASVLNYFLSPTEIKKGERVRLKVMANMSDGTTQDADNLNWTYEYDGEKLVQGGTNDGVLKIEQPDKKTVYITGLKQGEVLVHVTLAATSGANGKTVSQVVKVKNPIGLPSGSGADVISENIYQFNVNEDTITYQVNVPIALASKPATFKYTFELEPGIEPLQELQDGSTIGEHTDGGIDSSIVQLDGSAKPDFSSSLIDTVAKKYLNLKKADGNYVYKKLTVDVAIDGSTIQLIVVR